MKYNIMPFLVLLLWAGWVAAEPVTVSVEGEGAKLGIRLQNYRVSLLITPARGGEVSSYRDRLAPGELIMQKEYNGLCLDHFQGDGWPGEFLEAPYEFRILKQGPEEAQVLVSRTAKNGILLEKTYTLRADSPALTCSVKMTAPADASRTVAYWLQNVCFAGGEYDADTDRAFRPTVRGVRSTAKGGNGLYGTEDWIRDFTDGWMALVDTKKRSGLVLLTDYNRLSVSYVCGGNTTFEPMFNTVFIPAGKSHTETVQLLPQTGITRMLAATPQALLGYTITTDNKGNAALEFTAVRSTVAVKSLKLEVKLAGAVGGKISSSATANYTALTDAPQKQRVTFTDAPGDPVVVKVTASGETLDGKPFTLACEDFHAGAYQWGDNITTDMRTPLYTAARPEQTIALVKPDKLAVKRNYSARYLFFYGMLDDAYQVPDVMRMVAYHLPKPVVSYVSYDPSYYGNLSFFPYDYNDLLNYDVIVLGGAGRTALKPIGLEMLHDYLLAGGSMIVLGGHGAYGRSQLRGTKLGDALPVEVADTRFDLEPTGGKRVTMGPDTAIFTKDIAPSEAATCWYLHKAVVKPGAKVLMQVDGKPFMAAWEYGPKKARIICILGAPMGDPKAGQTPFWQDDMWPVILNNALIWAGPWPDGIRGWTEGL